MLPDKDLRTDLAPLEELLGIERKHANAASSRVSADCFLLFGRMDANAQRLGRARQSQPVVT